MCKEGIYIDVLKAKNGLFNSKGEREREENDHKETKL